MTVEQSTPLSGSQKVALDKLTAFVGPEYVECLAAQGPDVLNARVETFMNYGKALSGQIYNKIATAMPTLYVAMPPEEAKPRPLRVNV